MAKPSITQQREAVEALINGAISDELCAPSDVEAAKHAVLTLQYIETRPELARTLATIIAQYGARLVGVR